MRHRLPSYLLALVLLSLSVPPAQAQTPTPTYSASPTPAAKTGYFWLGEQLTSSVAITVTTPSSQSISNTSCQQYAAYAVAGIAVIQGFEGTTYALMNFYNAAGNSTGVLYRTSSGPNKLVYIAINNYHNVPDDVLQTIISAYTSATTSSEVYVDVIDIPPAARIKFNATLVTATSGTALGFNVLCWAPPIATPTPADLSHVALSSGSQLRLDRAVSYGDIAVVSAILGALLLALIYLFIRVPKLYTKP